MPLPETIELGASVASHYSMAAGPSERKAGKFSVNLFYGLLLRISIQLPCPVSGIPTAPKFSRGNSPAKLISAEKLQGFVSPIVEVGSFVRTL
jgi:hypothetical protein